jgi:ERCC4-type nuclease
MCGQVIGRRDGVVVRCYILQGLPGIGPRRARALLDQFGSVVAVVTADASALAEIAGIGDAVARSIHEALGEERSSDSAMVVRNPSSTT